jgi:hypothetical protein
MSSSDESVLSEPKVSYVASCSLARNYGYGIRSPGMTNCSSENKFVKCLVLKTHRVGFLLQYTTFDVIVVSVTDAFTILVLLQVKAT